jgi:ABC-type Fe3+/spermidine/putrescine transport system ATPase subunit
MPSLSFHALEKQFGSTTVLYPTTLNVAAGEFLTLLGPSGSGKTTLLSLAAGHLAPSGGRILIGERDVTQLPPRLRNIGMVFQDYALFPNLDVFENIAYGLRARRCMSTDIARRVRAALATVQLEGYDQRTIQQLSGGQKQRVALARALVIEPDVLLLDEPLGALDRQLRRQVQLEIRRLHRKLGHTTVFVTHDQEEALVLSDRIAILRDGRIEQIGSAESLYEAPVNTFVAGFLGDSNLIEGTVRDIVHGRAELAVPELSVTLSGAAGPGIAVGERAALLVRPEFVRLDEALAPALPATVEEIVYLGELAAIKSRLSTGAEIWCRRPARLGRPASMSVAIGWAMSDGRVLALSTPASNVASSAASSAAPGAAS